jgi:hypothetical protein
MNARRIILAFIAGFLATLIFHQGALAIMHELGWTDRAAYRMTSTKPFGVPAVFSLSFWGGVWGILLALFLGTRKTNWYLRALIFGALLPTAVAFFIVAPLKGQPIAAGWDPKLIVGALVLNGLWGLGTALIYRSLAR